MGQDTTNNINALYDFIYIDKNRLYSLVSQLNEKGFLTKQITSHNGSDTSSTQKNTQSGKAVNFKALVAEVNLGADNSSIQTESSTSGINIQDIFNTEHIAPSFLINKLIKSDLVTKKLNGSHGDLMYLSGSISIKDTAIMQKMYEPLSDVIFEGFQEAVGGKPSVDVQGVLAMLNSIPHMVNFSICTKMGNAWSTLNKDYFLVDYQDFMLKHGVNLAREWRCLAILDSKPLDSNEILCPTTIDSLEAIYDSVMPIVQEAFGMSSETYGISPIAIFRELNSLDKN